MKKEKVIQIKSHYEGKENTEYDELIMLDRKVKRPVLVFAYIFGILGSLVLGFGMCIAMEVLFKGLLWVGILIGCVGIIMVVINYFIYKKLLKHRQKKYGPQIISLSNQLLNE